MADKTIKNKDGSFGGIKKKTVKNEDTLVNKNDLKKSGGIKTITNKRQKKNKAIKDLKNKTKARYAAMQETARDTINPMKAERVFEKFKSPRNAKTFYANEPESKYEGMAPEAMNKRLDDIDKKPEMFKEIKNLKGGGKVKLALKGGGRAYGKNS
tara:strand:+ start:33 stop:497 length:465 start_codon:yes stop_codon:yes gene_type:complete